MKNKSYRPRLSIDLDESLANDIRNLIPHGLRGKVFLLILEDLIDLIKKHGSGVVLSTFIERDIGVKEISRLEVPNGNNREPS